jgi:hypothetical protein
MIQKTTPGFVLEDVGDAAEVLGRIRAAATPGGVQHNISDPAQLDLREPVRFVSLLRLVSG